MSLEGQCFELVDLIKEKLVDLHNILNEAFQKCFEGGKKCREQCFQSGGNYFEGDKAE